jgi:hypothetical protein
MGCTPTTAPIACKNGTNQYSAVHEHTVRDHPVCTDCSGARTSGRWNSPCPKSTHFVPWRMPQNLAYTRYLPCSPPHELTQDHVFLPVTHVGGPRRGPVTSGGLWFYYARGCSDLLWNTGRSMLARNRVHAAVIVEQRLALALKGVAISDREAISRVAQYAQKSFPRSILQSARARMGANESFHDILAEVARGLYGVCGPRSHIYLDDNLTLNPCMCKGGLHGWWNTTDLRRLASLGNLALHPTLDKHIATRARGLPIDTISLYQQPQGGWMFTTEIWDIRGSPVLSRYLENATSHPEVIALARWAKAGSSNNTRSIGVECYPASSWNTCMSCRGSSMEPHCNATAATIRENHQYR